MFVLQIETDNAAFDGSSVDEVKRIVTDAMSTMTSRCQDGHTEHWLRDINGNKVGFWRFTEYDEDETV